MSERSASNPNWITPMVLAVVLAIGLVCLVGFSIWMAHSGWNMRDHMGGMMGGGRSTSGNAVTIVTGDAQVNIGDFAFSPGNLQVSAGSKVTWTNSDTAPHNATHQGRDWATATLGKGESDSVTFSEVGDYSYYCTLHPSMQARIHVR